MRSAGRVVVGLLLMALALFHFFFGIANFGFVERLPENLDVLIEGVSAWVAAACLFWAMRNHLRGKPWAALVALGGSVFTAGMLISISTGASTPEMIQVVVPVLLVGGVAWIMERVAMGEQSGSSLQ